MQVLSVRENARLPRPPSWCTQYHLGHSDGSPCCVPSTCLPSFHSASGDSFQSFLISSVCHPSPGHRESSSFPSLSPAHYIPTTLALPSDPHRTILSLPSSTPPNPRTSLAKFTLLPRIAIEAFEIEPHSLPNPAASDIPHSFSPIYFNKTFAPHDARLRALLTCRVHSFSGKSNQTSPDEYNLSYEEEPTRRHSSIPPVSQPSRAIHTP